MRVPSVATDHLIEKHVRQRQLLARKKP